MASTGRASCELAIVGGGPAGLAAASLATELGLETVLFDEQAAPGGQVYRNVEANTQKRDAMGDVLGADYAKGRTLVERFRASGAAYEKQSAVWQVSANGKLGISQEGRSYLTKARRVILATGAMERPVPIPGWTLPGVMGAGAVQTLMKGSGIVPDQPTIIAGSGPLTYLVAYQLVKAGAPVRGILDTSGKGLIGTSLAALPLLSGFAADLLKGLSWIATLRANRIPVFKARNLSAEGASRLEAVTFDSGGDRRRLKASLLLLHEGVIPNIQITTSLRCMHSWNPVHMAWQPKTDKWGGTNVDILAVAGDGAGIGGARVAVHRGHLAALDAAYRLSHITKSERDDRALAAHHALEKEARFRAFLDQIYRPREAAGYLSDDTIVCRCEEITAGELRASIGGGFTDINQLKSFSRCGMGQCQGRMCGSSVGRLLAESLNVDVEAVGHYRLRLPVKPLPLAELAKLSHADPDPGLSLQAAGTDQTRHI